MATTRYDVLGIGNAIVDVIARADDDFLVKHGMTKGAHGADRRGARAGDLRRRWARRSKISGGSAANTIVGVCEPRRARGVRRQGEGRRARPGLHARHPRRRRCVRHAARRRTGPSTARCYILVTPDGERTMNTYLGAAQDLHAGDIDRDAIAAAAITYLEGYLWDPPHAKEAFRKAAQHRAQGRPQGRADAVGCVLRRSLSRRVPQADPRPAPSTSCSPTSASCIRSTRPRDFDTALAGAAQATRSLRS